MYCNTCLIVYRQEEIDEDIEVQLQENGFIDNFARGTAHMFRYNLAYCCKNGVT